MQQTPSARALAIVACVGAPLAVGLGVPLLPADWEGEAERLRLYAAFAPVLALGALLVQAAPSRWVPAVQTITVVTTWLLWRIAQWEDATGPAALVATPLVAAAVLALRRESLAQRRGVVLVGSAVMIGLLATTWPWEKTVVGVLLQAIAIAGAAGGGWPEGRTTSILRAFTAANAAIATPLPADEVGRSDRSVGCVLRGAGWLLGGVIALALGSALARSGLDPSGLARSGYPQPLAELRALRLPQALVAAVALWSVLLLKIGGLLFLDAGALRMLGMPVSAPLDAPWRSRDMLDYWRRANVWRYRMMVEGYQRLFLPMHGRWMPLGVFVVFLASGLHHAAHLKLEFFQWIRWSIEGFLCAVNAWWRGESQRRSVLVYVRTRQRPSVSRWRAGLATAGVIVIHGFLMNISRTSAGDRAWIRGLWPWDW